MGHAQKRGRRSHFGRRCQQVKPSPHAYSQPCNLSDGSSIRPRRDQFFLGTFRIPLWYQVICASLTWTVSASDHTLANWLPTSYLPERILGPIAQAEEMAHGIQEAVRVFMVFMRLGDDRADGRPGVVEELVLEPHGHVGNRGAIGIGKVGTGGEEGVQLALANLVGMIA